MRRAGKARWQRKQDRSRQIIRDAVQRRQISHMHRLGHSGQYRGGFDEFRCGLVLAFGIDYLGPAIALGLGLPRYRTDHALVEVDVLDLDSGHLDAPRVGQRIEDSLDVGVQPLARRKHSIELVLSEHGAERGLRELIGGRTEVLDLDGRPFGIHDPEVHDGIHADRYIVPGNNLLWRNVENPDSEIDPHHRLN